MADIWPKVAKKIASHGNYGRLADGYLDGKLDCANWVDQFSLLSNQNPTWNG